MILTYIRNRLNYPHSSPYKDMIQKYPVGIQDFEKLRSENFLYIDKTEFIYKMVDIGGYYFLLRPRMFGKSLFISTLESLFLGKK